MTCGMSGLPMRVAQAQGGRSFAPGAAPELSPISGGGPWCQGAAWL